MAVNINIPGVGTVSADNAASESTLRQLVSAINSQQQQSNRADRDLANATKQQANYADRAAESMAQLASNARSSESASRNLFNDLERNIQKASTQSSNLADPQVGEYLKRLGTIASATGQSLARMAGEIPRDPLRVAVGMLEKSLYLAVDGISIFPNLFGKILPAGLQKALGSVTGEAGKFVKTLGSEVIGLLSAELNATVRGFRDMNQMGVSFARGMSDMREYSFQAGLTVDQFTNSMRKSEASLKTMGVSTDQAIRRVAKVTEIFGTTAGASTNTLRREMMLLGYTMEDQTELAAEFMAQERARMTQDQFRAMTEKDLALGTRKYAEDLKVLRDITGQDARAARERARVEVQRAGLLNKLGPQQKKAFEEANAVMQKLPANIQNALMNRLMGQPITDATIASSEELTNMIENIAQGVLAGQEGMQKTTMMEIANTQEKVIALGKEGKGLYALSDQLSALNVGGMVADFARTINAFILDPLTAEQIKTAYANVGKSASTTDQLTNTVVDLQENLQAVSVLFSKKLTPMLEPFGEALKTATQLMTDFTLITTQLVTGRRQKPGGRPEETEPYGSQDYLNDMAALFYKHLEKPLTEIGTRLIEVFSSIVVPTNDEQAVNRFSDAVDRFAMAIPNTSTTVGGMYEAPNSGILAELSNNQSSIPINPMIAANNKQATTPIPGEYNDVVQKIDALFNNPNLMTSTLAELKNILSSDSQATQSLLSQNMQKMDTLITTAQDALRVNERMLSELA